MTNIFCDKAHNLSQNKLLITNHHTIRNNIPNNLAYTMSITNIAISKATRNGHPTGVLHEMDCFNLGE